MHEGFPWDLLRTDWPEVVQVTVSRSRRAELAKLFGSPEDRITVVPNGIDPAALLGLASGTEALVEKFHLLDAAPLILLPARITPRKNIEMALRIMARLRDRHPHARMLVTGPTGPHSAANAAYLDSLVALQRELELGDTVLFLTLATGERIPDEMVGDLYRLADVLLLPSSEEGFGIPVLEAGLIGIPVFCSDIEPLKELGGEDVQYFSPHDDPGRVAEDIRLVLDGSQLYRLRKRVIREYSWPRIYSDHLAPLLARE
jgi:glycosyltransferase involved in cell wall biosynthesis